MAALTPSKRGCLTHDWVKDGAWRDVRVGIKDKPIFKCKNCEEILDPKLGGKP